MNRSFFALVMLVGCSDIGFISKDDGPSGPQPDILVTPPALEFKTLSMDETQKKPFNVQNVGDATLHVADVVIGSGLSYRIATRATQFDLEPGESTDIEVEFTPMGANENYGQVIVASDDYDTPQAMVDLLGFGAVPELKITPETYVFGDAVIPCGDTKELTLENVGTEDLEITDFSYTSNGMLSLANEAAMRGQLPLVLKPGQTSKVTVAFAPATAGGDTGRLDVISNDPREVVSADQSGEGTYVDENDETFTEPGVPPVDVLLLIDNSCSMESDNMDDVRNGFPGFVTELQNVSDWQLAEVVRDSGCAEGGILDSSSPNPDTSLINNAFPGSYGFLTESLLQLADVALSKTGPGQCNEGFLRPGALLHIIVLSDEREQSGRTGDYWVTQYQNYVSSPEFVKVSGVLDLNYNCGDNTGPVGYIDAVNATGGATMNICNANWGAQFRDIASEIVAGTRTYNLSDNADPNSVEVTVNGNPTNDVTVSGANVTINSPPVGEGDVVEINYGVLAECN